MRSNGERCKYLQPVTCQEAGRHIYDAHSFFFDDFSRLMATSLIATVTAVHLQSSKDESVKEGFYAGHSQFDGPCLLLYCDSGQLR